MDFDTEAFEMNTAQIKKARLEAIVDEVKQLHPLLKLLLPKMPRVQHVEYTHGTNEMGADFVFSSLSEIFGDLEYSGVIAKLGKISQDYSDIERQIKECEIERFFGNGRKKIFISEIWVITTGSITSGAQTKIHSEYKTRKIIFIDGDRLSSLIDKHLPNYWTDVPLEIGDYLHSIWTANDRLDRSLSLIATKNERFYIDQDIFEAEEFDRKRRKPPKVVDIFESIDRHNVLLVEGGMGAGKSKLLRALIDNYATAPSYLKTKLLPVFVTFKDFVEKFNGDPVFTIESLIPVDVRTTKEEHARYLLLIDGVDEKNMPTDELVEAFINSVKAIEDAGIKAVITSRWSEVFEQNGWIRKNLKRLELRPLSTNRLLEFIKTLCRELDVKSRLIEDLKKSTLFKELPRSPIAAILLAQLLSENAMDLPSNLTELYAKYTELSLGRWDVHKGLQTQKEFEALSAIITNLAEDFMNNQLAEIPLSEARGYFSRYLTKRNLGLQPESLFQKLISRCDIVTIDPNSEVFQFKHKSFIEFFYAKSYLKKPIVVDERVWNSYWATSFYFYVGLQKDCPDLLTEILKIPTNSEGARWMRLLNTSNYLLAGSSSPYEIAEATLGEIMIESADLYLEITEGKINSPFSVFSKMHFLWFMQMLLRRGYSYDFFKKAIEVGTLHVSEKGGDPKRCAIATFFLSVIGRELGEKSSFDFLLKNYSKALPLELELAVRHETKKEKRSAIVKKMDQRVNRAIRDTPGLQDFISTLYDRPLRSLKKIA